MFYCEKREIYWGEGLAVTSSSRLPPPMSEKANEEETLRE